MKCEYNGEPHTIEVSFGNQYKKGLYFKISPQRWYYFFLYPNTSKQLLYSNFAKNSLCSFFSSKLVQYLKIILALFCVRTYKKKFFGLFCVRNFQRTIYLLSFVFEISLFALFLFGTYKKICFIYFVFKFENFSLYSFCVQNLRKKFSLLFCLQNFSLYSFSVKSYENYFSLLSFVFKI